jgi:hypothetical protein
VGKEAVKTGSKIAARYSASIGEVLDDAMIELSWGSRALFLFRELVLFSKEQIWVGSFRHTLS